MPITVSNQINLSSATASIKNGSSNSVMIFNMHVMKKDPDVIYNEIAVINAQIPVSYYIINENNDKFVLSTATYTLTHGNYNASSFKTMLLALLGAGYAMTLDNSNGKFTLSKTGGYTIMPTTTCWKILGIQRNTTYVVPHTLEFPYPCNFLGVNRLKIKSGVFKTNNLDSNSGGHSDLLCTIPVDVSMYSLIKYTNVVGFKNVIHNEDINYIDITITDEDDTIIDFNGIDLHLTLQINSIVKDYENDFSLGNLMKKMENQT